MAVAQDENVDLATKVGRLEGAVAVIQQTLTRLEQRVERGFAELRKKSDSDVKELRTEFGHQLSELRTEFRSEIASMRAENRWIGLVLAALIGALGFWR